jgi:hypothetical protein
VVLFSSSFSLHFPPARSHQALKSAVGPAIPPSPHLPSRWRPLHLTAQQFIGATPPPGPAPLTVLGCCGGVERSGAEICLQRNLGRDEGAARPRASSGDIPAVPPRIRSSRYSCDPPPFHSYTVMLSVVSTGIDPLLPPALKLLVINCVSLLHPCILDVGTAWIGLLLVGWW